MIALTKRKKLVELVENTSSEVLFNSLWESAEKFVSQYNSELDASVKRIEKGEFFTQDEVDSRLESWENK
jgi:predicted transcriptional regulator